jgi:hypothetical protein
MKNRFFAILFCLLAAAIFAPTSTANAQDCTSICVPMEQLFIYGCPDGTVGQLCVIGEGNCKINIPCTGPDSQ